MEALSPFKTFLSTLMAVLISLTLIGSAGAANLAQAEPPQSSSSQIEVISPYYSIEHLTTSDGTQITGSIISGPPHPLPEFQAQRAASMTTIEPEGSLANFPSYSWVFGCSSVSGAMIAAWYDRGSYPNMYAGPTNGGVMPLTDTSWSTWSDGSGETYPNNPLVASHNGVDGRTIKGSIEDYWISNNSNALDPYLTGGWSEHAWGDAIGDYMKTSQSAYGNSDGSTTFYTWRINPEPLTCADMVNNGISTMDGTYGRKLFYEARGYTVTDCYNQTTNNNGGGFTLADYQAEIDAGHPVMLNLEGHTVVGFGYDGSTIYIRDTWDNNPANTYTMLWGGSYEGMQLLSVSVVKANVIIKPPSPPTGISASDGAYTDRIRVSWGGSGNFEYKIYLPLILNGGLGSTPEAPFFEVYRNSTNSTIGAIKLADHHAASPYDDTSASPGATYYYWVKACNSGGCSSYSASDSGYRQVTTPPTNPFLNPGFEEGPTAWSQSSSNGWDLIVTESYVSAHSGSWLAWLGGGYNEVGLLSQTITISAAAPYLYFWYRAYSLNTCGHDYFRVAVDSTNIYNMDLCDYSNTDHWAMMVLDLSAYVGLNKTVQFSINTENFFGSSLFLDDVSMSASAATTNMQPVGTELYPGAIFRGK